MTVYKVTYFNIMSLGEPIRFILSYGGVNFEDVRVDKPTQWPDMKPTTPFGKLPTLEINGKVYHQSLPICRYLARQFNIAGKTDLDALEIDAIANSLHDFKKELSAWYFDEDPVSWAKKKDAIVNGSLPYYMKRFEEIVKNNGGYFHDGELSYADLFFTGLYHHFNGFLGFDVIKDYPNLRELTDKVLTLPKIAAWVAKRPKSAV